MLKLNCFQAMKWIDRPRRSHLEFVAKDIPWRKIDSCRDTVLSNGWPGPRNDEFEPLSKAKRLERQRGIGGEYKIYRGSHRQKQRNREGMRRARQRDIQTGERESKREKDANKNDK